MYSWTCEDLDDLEIYAAERVENPDWGSYDIMYSMTDRAYACDIIGHFSDDMAEAKAAGTAFDSGIIRAARIFANNALQDLYMQVSITMDTDGYCTFMLGYGNGTGWDYVYSTTTVSWPEFSSWSRIDREFNFMYLRDRHPLTEEGMPNYTGAIYLVMIMGAVEKYIGTWLTPQSPGRPYGRMDYTYTGIGSLTDIPGGAFPCASDDPDSRSQQSELVARLPNGQQGKLSMIYRSESDTHFCGVDGNYNPDPDDPRNDPNEEDPGGNSKPGGGDGDHRQPYTPIPIPGIPTIGPNSAGFVYMLRMTPAQMQQFAVDLVRPTWWTALKNFFADPLDFICGIMIVPYEPVSNYSVYPKFGDNVFDHAYPQVYQQYTVIDCGNLAVPKYFGGALDQNPFTKLLVWLPYIGYRELDADECMDKTLHIVYHCDCLTGDCVCFISTVAGSGYEVPFDRVIAQFSGNCGVRVPFGATSFDAAIAASVQLLGGAVGAIAGGAMGAAIGAGAVTESQIANSIAGTTIGAVQGSKVTTERSGVSGACAGYLSIQYPYLLREVPRQSLAKNYMELEGYPSNVAGPLVNFDGFTAVESINLNGINATKEELDEIRSILAGGVYI